MQESSGYYNKLKENPAELIKILHEKDDKILRLETYLVNLQRGLLYGSKKQKLSNVSPDQLSLFDNLKDKGVSVPEEPKVEAPAISVKPYSRAARVKRDLSKLPHIRIEHSPETTECRNCGSEMLQIGEDISRELESQPARLFVNEHVRPRLACNCCKDGVHQDPLPVSVKPLERSIVGAGLLAEIHVAKYVDHLPLHRQEQIFLRRGYQITRNSMSCWLGLAHDNYLLRLWLALKQELFTASYLQGDETTIKVQDNLVAGECHRGYLWGTFSPEKKIVCFEYAESRAGEVASQIYANFSGVLQTDAYAGTIQLCCQKKCTELPV